MRIRIVLAAALALTVATPAYAGQHAEPLDARQGIEVGRAAATGVNGPDDVYITDDGTIYWTEILTGFVGMLKPDGTFTRQFVGQGVNPITMSDDELACS